MAKRRRLNKRVVVLLVAIGLLLGAVVIAFVIIRSPGDPKVLVPDAKRALDKGDYLQAVLKYTQAIGATKERGEKCEWLVARGRVRLEWVEKDPALGKSRKQDLFGQAMADFREATRLDPGSVQARREQTKWAWDIALSQEQQGQGDWVPYVESADQLLKLVPDDDETRYNRAYAHTRLAEAQPTFVKPALDDINELMRRNPKEEKYWLLLGRFQRRNEELGRIPKGQVEDLYRQALLANSESVDLRVDFADYLLRQDRKAEAMDLLRKAVELNPTELRGYLALAQAYRQDKDVEKAKDILAQAMAKAPDDPRPYEELARIHAALREPDQAEAILAKGLEAIEKATGDSPSLDQQRASRYHSSLVRLNYQLCDALLDRLGEGGDKEEILPRVNAALGRMKGVMAQIRGVEDDHPWAEKIEGRLALVDGDLVKAEKLLRSAYEQFLRDPRIGFESRTARLLIDIYDRLNQPGEAGKIIQIYRSLAPDNAGPMMLLARLNMGYRRFDDVAQNLAAVLKVDPENKEALAMKGVVDILNGGAERLPEGVVQIDGRSAAMLLGRARQLWLEGQQPPALTVTAEVFRVQPGNLDAARQLIQWCQLRKEADMAKAVMDRAKAFYKDKPEVLEHLVMLFESDPKVRKDYSLKLAAQDPNPIQRAVRTASIHAAYGENDEQFRYLQEAETLGPNDPAVIEAIFDYHLRRSDWEKAGVYAGKAVQWDVDTVGGKLFQARLAAAQSQWDEAIGLINAALRQRSRFSLAHSFLGDCHMAKRDYDSAQKAYNQAYEQDPANFRALLGLVRVSELTGKTADYDHYVQLAYRFRPNDPEIRERYLRLRESGDEPEAIIRHREQIRLQQPGNLANLYQLAQLYQRVGRVGAAEGALNDILKRQPDNVSALSLLARLLREADRAAEGFGKLTQYAERTDDKVGAYMLLSGYLEENKDLQAAANACQAAIDADPKDPRGHANMARFRANRGEWSEAVSRQRKFIEVAGDKATSAAEEALIGFMIEAGQFKDVDARIQALLQADPNNARLLARKGFSLLRQDRYDEALDALNRAMNADSSYTQALLWRAETYRAKGEMARCVSDLVAARQRDPSWPATVVLVRMYESMGDFPNARTALRSFLSERPGYEPALRELVLLCQRHNRRELLEEVLAEAIKLYPRSLFFIGAQMDLWLDRGEAARAVRALEAIRRILPQSVEINTLLARAQVHAGMFDQAIEQAKPYQAHEQVGPVMTAVTGMALAKKGQQPLADEHFKTALTKAEGESQVGQVVASIIAAYGNEPASRKLIEWTSTRPNDWQYRLLTASALMTAEDYKSAREQLLKALDLTDKPSQRFRVVRQLALAHYQLGEFQDSRKRYEEAMGLDPSDSMTLNNLAWLLVQNLKQPKEALPHAERSVRLQPYSPQAMDTLGLILTAMGDDKRAEETLLRSISVEAMSANLLHLGELYEKMERKDDAIRYYRQGWEKVKDKPNDDCHPALRDALKRLGELPAG